MPTIKEYGIQTSVQGPAGIAAPVFDFGGLAQGITAAGDAIRKRQEQGELSDIQVATAQARAEWTVEFEKRAQAAPLGDTTFLEKFDEDFTNALGELGGDYSTRAGRMAWQEAQASLRGQFYAAAGKFQVDSAGKKAVADYQSAMNLNRNTLAHDPSQFDVILADTMAALENPNGPYGAMDAAMRETLKTQTRETLALSAVDGLARKNPQAALASLKAGEWDEYVDADKMFQLQSRAETIMKAQEIELNRQIVLGEKAKTAASEAAMDQYIADIFSDAPKKSAQDIATDDTLKPRDKLTMLGVIERSTKPDPLSEVSHQTASELFRRVMLPDSDPQKITDETVINQAYIDGLLTRTDLDWTRKQFQDARTPEGERLGARRKSFFDAIEPQIASKGMFGVLDDPKGAEQFYQYQRMVERKEQEYRDAGKDPFSLYDPNSPDYVGKPELVNSFRRTPQQLMQDMEVDINSLSVDTPAAPSAVEQPPAETFDLNGQQLPVEEKRTVDGVTYYKVGGAWYSK